MVLVTFHVVQTMCRPDTAAKARKYLYFFLQFVSIQGDSGLSCSGNIMFQRTQNKTNSLTSQTENITRFKCVIVQYCKVYRNLRINSELTKSLQWSLGFCPRDMQPRKFFEIFSVWTSTNDVVISVSLNIREWHCRNSENQALQVMGRERVTPVVERWGASGASAESNQRLYTGRYRFTFEESVRTSNRDSHSCFSISEKLIVDSLAHIHLRGCHMSAYVQLETSKSVGNGNLYSALTVKKTRTRLVYKYIGREVEMFELVHKDDRDSSLFLRQTARAYNTVCSSN